MAYTKDQYEREMREFEWNIPSDYNIVDVVEDHAAKMPHKVAVFWEDSAGNKREVTFSALAEKARRFGAGLMRLGLKKGDPVLHVLPRLPEAHSGAACSSPPSRGAHGPVRDVRRRRGGCAMLGDA